MQFQETHQIINTFNPYMPSVMKKRSMTRSSGVVETFTLWIVSSSSQRTWVTSTENPQKLNHDFNYSIRLQYLRCRILSYYHVIILSYQGKRPSTGRLVKGWVLADRKRKQRMKDRLKEGDFSSSPTSPSWGQDEESPKIPHSTISHQLKHL